MPSNNQGDKKQTSINFTKKFKFYRENTPNSSCFKAHTPTKTTEFEDNFVRNSFDQKVLKIEPENLKLENFNLLRELGEGKYGKVYLAHHRTTNFICAIKTISKRIIIEENLKDTFIQEIKIQSYLNHPNIVKLYGYFTDIDNFYLVMEYCPDQHLLHMIKIKRIFEEQEIIDILSNVF